MDVFGEHWRSHDRRMAAAWDERVGVDDIVLVPGDLSWAMTLEEAAPDLAWIGQRPGRKILLRGNHDYWWASLSKVRRALPRGCEPLQNDAIEAGGRIVVGSRGWTDPLDPASAPEDAAIFRREIERLKLSVAAADQRWGRSRPRIAMLHYPPWIEGREPSEVVGILEGAGVTDCVYGHLHGDDHRLGVTGERHGIRYWLVAADAVGFAPVEIPKGLPESTP